MSAAIREFGGQADENLPTIIDKNEDENSNYEFSNQYEDSVLSQRHFTGVQSFPLRN